MPAVTTVIRPGELTQLAQLLKLNSHNLSERINVPGVLVIINIKVITEILIDIIIIIIQIIICVITGLVFSISLIPFRA